MTDRLPAHVEAAAIRRRAEAQGGFAAVLKKGDPVVLELTSQDREHGFRQEELGIRVDVKPGETARVRLVPQQTGSFAFACDVFCGSGHEEMAGEIAVVD